MLFQKPAKLVISQTESLGGVALMTARIRQSLIDQRRFEELHGRFKIPGRFQ